MPHWRFSMEYWNVIEKIYPKQTSIHSEFWVKIFVQQINNQKSNGLFALSRQFYVKLINFVELCDFIGCVLFDDVVLLDKTERLRDPIKRRKRNVCITNQFANRSNIFGLFESL